MYLLNYLASPIFRLLLAPRIPTVVRTPEARFEGLDKLGYNFPPNYLTVDVRSIWKTPYKEQLETTPGLSNMTT